MSVLNITEPCVTTYVMKSLSYIIFNGKDVWGYTASM